MRFDSGPEVFVRVNRNYVLTEYVLNENDCKTKTPLVTLYRYRFPVSGQPRHTLYPFLRYSELRYIGSDMSTF